MHLLGIDRVGVNAQNGRKLLLTIVLIAVLLAVSWGMRSLAGLLVVRSKSAAVQTRLWTRQGISVVTAVILLLGILSIWFSDPTRPGRQRHLAWSRLALPSRCSRW